MLKNLFINILLMLIISRTAFSQTSLNIEPLSDTVKTSDSLLLKAEADTIIEKTVDTINIKDAAVSIKDSLKKVDNIPGIIEQTLLENLQLNPLNIIESINFWTFIQLFIWILIGTALVKLINRTSKSKFVIKKFPFFTSILSILKISVWLIVFYIILFWVLNVPQNLLWILLLVIFVIFGGSTLPFLKNIVGGFYISLSSPFEAGNNIIVNGLEGEVVDINWRTVKILTEDNNEISIPNSIFLHNPVTNISFGEKERLIVLEYSFPFKYESDEIIKILKEAALSSPYLFNETEPRVFLVKADFVNKINTYEINAYIIDIKFENEFRSLYNTIILNSMKNAGSI